MNVEAGIIATETGEKLAEAVGFRNHLAHRYGDVDHDLAYDVLQEDLEWLDRFQQEIATWFLDRYSIGSTFSSIVPIAANSSSVTSCPTPG